VKRHLGAVPGSTVSLILRANDIPADGEIDVVVHLHGFSEDHQNMSLRSKEAFSGLDFLNPEDSGQPAHGTRAADAGDPAARPANVGGERGRRDRRARAPTSGRPSPPPPG